MTNTPKDHSNKRTPSLWVSVVLIGILVAAASFWAGRTTLTSHEVPEQDSADKSFVEVTEQELGQVLTLTTTMSRPTEPLSYNFLAGVLTSAEGDGEFQQGDLLYQVDDIEVRLVEGQYPFWRDLSPGTEGEDVRQLQQMLSNQGFDTEVDGLWGADTSAAVAEWQSERSVEIRDSIQLGELVSAPNLPVNISFASEYRTTGAHLTGSEAVLTAPAGEPEFSMEVTPGQAEMIPAGTEVTVQGDENSWTGITADSSVGEDGLVTIDIAAPGGGLLCGDTCNQLPSGETNYLVTEVAVVPPVTAPVVPVSSITTKAGGTATVQVEAEEGSEVREIEVMSIADGLASVQGVDVGERVLVLGEDAEGESVEDAPSDPPGEAETASLHHAPSGSRL